MSLITPEFRGTWVFLTHPQVKDKNKPENGKAYSITAYFPPTADLSAMKKAAQEAIEKKFGSVDKAPKVFRSPFRLNEEQDNPQEGIPGDWTMMRFSMNEFNKDGQPQKPGLVDANLNDIIDSTEVYSGAWFRAQVNASWYDKSGNKGVGFYLQNVQKLRDDEPLGKGRIPASKAFEAVGGAPSGSKTASGLFD